MIGLLKPYKLPFFNKLELMNEFTVLVINYHFLCFTDFVSDLPTRIVVGFSLITATGYVIVANIGIILVDSLTQAYKRIKWRYIRN